MPEIKINVTYQKEVIRDFYLFHFKVKTKLFWIYFSIAFLSVIVACLLIVFGKLLGLIFGTLLLSLTLVVFILYPKQIRLLAERKADSTPKKEDEVYLFSSFIYKENDRDKVYSWQQVASVYETESYLFIYFQDKNVIIVSKVLNVDNFKNLVESVRIHNKVVVKYLNKKII